MIPAALARAIALANAHPGIPDSPLIAKCAEAAMDGAPQRLEHIAAHDVPRLLREIVRHREWAA